MAPKKLLINSLVVVVSTALAILLVRNWPGCRRTPK
jgi:hypothetical protein